MQALVGRALDLAGIDPRIVVGAPLARQPSHFGPEDRPTKSFTGHEQHNPPALHPGLPFPWVQVKVPCTFEGVQCAKELNRNGVAFTLTVRPPGAWCNLSAPPALCTLQCSLSLVLLSPPQRSHIWHPRPPTTSLAPAPGRGFITRTSLSSRRQWVQHTLPPTSGGCQTFMGVRRWVPARPAAAFPCPQRDAAASAHVRHRLERRRSQPPPNSVRAHNKRMQGMNKVLEMQRMLDGCASGTRLLVASIRSREDLTKMVSKVRASPVVPAPRLWGPSSSKGSRPHALTCLASARALGHGGH